MSDVELNVPFYQGSRIGAEEKAENGPRPIKAQATCITDHRTILKVIPRIHETEGYGDIGTITEFVYNSLMAVGTSMATVDHIWNINHRSRDVTLQECENCLHI